MNPNKYRSCQFLVRHHVARGDKVLVFSDNVFALKTYAKLMGELFIYGETSQTERIRILDQFQKNPNVNCVFISKVGDNAIDLPEATVVVQISAHYGSRRQEAQRLGRILRPKARAEGEYNAFFYSLVSKDTEEMFYSAKRQQFLIDQGYAFKAVTHLTDLDTANLGLSSKTEQLEVLSRVLQADDREGNEEDLGRDVNDIASTPLSSGGSRSSISGVKRKAGSMSTLSGVQDMNYLEYSVRSSKRQANTPTNPGKSHMHKLFKEREKLN